MENNIKVFKALADETRIKILILLTKRNICAKGIARHLDISEAAVSQHIKILKEIDLVIGYKRGYHVVYEINKEVLKGAVEFMNHIISDDTDYFQNQFDLSEKENRMQCSDGCKSIRRCCRRNFEED